MALTPLDDIAFWTRQLSEHALFFSLGIELEPFRSQAKALHNDFERARTLLEGLTLDKARALFSPPVKNLREYQVGLYDKLKGGTWAGWIFPLFVQHTTNELDYFVGRAWYAGWKPGESACFNVRFMSEHAAFAAHLLDPSEAALIRQAVAIRGQLEQLETGCAAVGAQFQVLSKQAGAALDAYLSTQPLTKNGASVIHPVLAAHVVREGRRFLETIPEWG
jgi:hypothetical protein